MYNYVNCNEVYYMKIISIKENPDYKQAAIEYFQKKWATENSMMVYDDCITHCIGSPSPLPQWYLLMDGEKIAGCAGLITNDFVSRMDLYPWLCALYIEPDYRGNEYGKLLIEKGKQDAKDIGFENIYLVSDHRGYYEHYGFERIATGYHPWGETSGIFRCRL